MEQNLTNDIVALLLRGDLHTRAIAEQLGASHVTVQRKLRGLIEENVVDFRTVGKNKVYRIRRTLEGRNAAIIAEVAKQTQIISRYPVLRGIFRAVGTMQELPLVILFGSFARGTATNESDIDIFIANGDSQRKKELEQRNSRVSIKTGPFDTSDLLIREIMKDHVIIRGVEVYFDKTGFLQETA